MELFFLPGLGGSGRMCYNVTPAAARWGDYKDYTKATTNERMEEIQDRGEVFQYESRMLEHLKNGERVKFIVNLSKTVIILENMVLYKYII